MDKKFISGVFNYCDRWCERCTLTSRCRVYERTSNPAPEKLDTDNEAFWQVISSNFKEASELIQKAAAGEGVDITNIPQEELEEIGRRQEEIDAEVDAHPLILLAELYVEKTIAFLENQARPEILNKAKELMDQLQMGLRGETDTVYTMVNLKDCEEIIRWYLFFIRIKLQRAVGGKIEGEYWEADNGFQKDSDGTAKIAIIAIERCIGAWKKMYELIPSCEDVAFPVLSLLTQLKHQTHAEFPNAMRFRRPGFDDAELN